MAAMDGETLQRNIEMLERLLRMKQRNREYFSSNLEKIDLYIHSYGEIIRIEIDFEIGLDLNSQI